MSISGSSIALKRKGLATQSSKASKIPLNPIQDQRIKIVFSYFLRVWISRFSSFVVFFGIANEIGIQMIECWMLRTQDLPWNCGIWAVTTALLWLRGTTKGWNKASGEDQNHLPYLKPAFPSRKTCMGSAASAAGAAGSGCRLHSKEKPKTNWWSKSINHCQEETAAVKHVRLYQTLLETPLLHAAAIDLSEILHKGRR